MESTKEILEAIYSHRVNENSFDVLTLVREHLSDLIEQNTVEVPMNIRHLLWSCVLQMHDFIEIAGYGYSGGNNPCIYFIMKCRTIFDEAIMYRPYKACIINGTICCMLC